MNWTLHLAIWYKMKAAYTGVYSTFPCNSPVDLSAIELLDLSENMRLRTTKNEYHEFELERLSIYHATR